MAMAAPTCWVSPTPSACSARLGRVKFSSAMVESVTQAELVRRIAERDDAREAEAELCRRYAPRIRLYGLRHLRSEDLAADLVQAVLLAVLSAAREGRIAEPEHLERFVLGTCRHVAMRVRKSAARLTPADSAELDVAVSLPDVARIDTGALIRCMSKLEPRARAVLLLTFQAEAAVAEIGEQLEMSAGNVRVVRHRALASLRHCLDGGERSPQ